MLQSCVFPTDAGLAPLLDQLTPVYSNVCKNNVVLNATTGIIYHILATIPLKFLHDYFAKMCLARNCYYILSFNTHTNVISTVTLAMTGTTTCAITAGNVVSPYGVCPFQLSPFNINANAATMSTGFNISLSDTATGIITTTLRIATSPLGNAYSHPQSSCRLVIPI